MARMRNVVRGAGFIFGCFILFTISVLLLASKALSDDYVLALMMVAGGAIVAAIIGAVVFSWRVLFSRGEEGRKDHAQRKHTPHPKCEACEDMSAPVMCSTHGMALCIRCMFGHDTPGVCTYEPHSDRRASYRASLVYSRSGVKQVPATGHPSRFFQT